MKTSVEWNETALLYHHQGERERNKRDFSVPVTALRTHLHYVAQPRDIKTDEWHFGIGLGSGANKTKVGRGGLFKRMILTHYLK